MWDIKIEDIVRDYNKNPEYYLNHVGYKDGSGGDITVNELGVLSEPCGI